MKNIKDKVYEALLTVSKHVSDSYPGTWAEDATIQYVEEQNNVYEASSSENGLQEDKALSGTGLISGTERARQQQHLPWMRQ